MNKIKKNNLLLVPFGCFIALAFFFSATPAKADYYAQGVLASKNILSGAEVTAISSFQTTSVIPASTTASVKFSQNKVNYYNSGGTKEGWDVLADGTDTVDLSGLGWTGGLLFYKLKFTTSVATATPAVSAVQINYTGTAVPEISGIIYYNQGIVESKNLLSGATVSAINSFQATTSLPAGTFMSIKFSQNKVDYYNSSSTKEGWDNLSNGAISIDLSGLGWSGGSFFYKIQMESALDETLQPKVSAVQVDYDGSAVPSVGAERYAESTLVSTNLLSGFGEELAGDKYFVYNISSLPYGTNAYAQFSNDGLNWYNSAAELRGWDTLIYGDHLSYDTALNLEKLTWIGTGTPTFYYKLRLNTTVDFTTTPILKKAGLLRRITKINPDNHPGGQVRVNSPQVDRMTGGLVGIWSFNGLDISGVTAFDRSSGGHNGTLTGGARLDSGQLGQAVAFDGAAGYVSIGNVANGIKTVAFWMKAEPAVSRKIMDFDGTRQIEINSSSQIAATGFPAPTIYVNGVATSTVNTDWRFVAVTDTTGVNGTAVDLGRVGAGYFKGVLDEVRFYNIVLSPDEIFALYRLGYVKIKR
jgi:hypothetical protein